VLPSLEDLLSQPRPQTAAELWRKAEQLAGKGNHLEAVRALYLAALALLHQAHLIHYERPPAPNGEYVRTKYISRRGAGAGSTNRSIALDPGGGAWFSEGLFAFWGKVVLPYLLVQAAASAAGKCSISDRLTRLPAAWQRRYAVPLQLEQPGQAIERFVNRLRAPRARDVLVGRTRRWCGCARSG